MDVNTEKIKAAFVITFDSFLAENDLTLYDKYESTIDNVRDSIPIDLKTCLDNYKNSDSIDYAFVLLYEGLGQYREHDDFTFESFHLDYLIQFRENIDLSYDDCVRLLGDS